MIRSFFAIELPGAVEEEIERLQSRLRRTGADVKWVSSRSVHLTLKFLGDVDAATIPKLAAAVRQALTPHRPLGLRVGRTGVFPGRSKARVVWLGLAGDLEALAAVQRDVETAVAGFGFEPENRPFKPHLTLGRVRSGRGRVELLAELDRLDPRPAAFTAHDVVLFKSDLKPTGAVYTVLERLPLGEHTTEETK